MAAKGEIRQLLTGRAVIWSDPNAKYEFDIEIKKPDGSTSPSVDESGYFLDKYPLTKIQPGQIWIPRHGTSVKIMTLSHYSAPDGWIWSFAGGGLTFPETKIIADYRLYGTLPVGWTSSGVIPPPAGVQIVWSIPVAHPSKNKCPLCGQPAYIGFSTVECETPGCKNAKPIQRPLSVSWDF